MATQNQNSSSAIPSSKSGIINTGARVDGHSVTKRLQQELRSLMVCHVCQY